MILFYFFPFGSLSHFPSQDTVVVGTLIALAADVGLIVVEAEPFSLVVVLLHAEIVIKNKPRSKGGSDMSE